MAGEIVSIDEARLQIERIRADREARRQRRMARENAPRPPYHPGGIDDLDI